MLAEERKQRIVEIVNDKRIVKVTELSRMLQATEATVRRDLEELQKKERLRRIHGGAAAINQKSKPKVQEDLLALCIEEKKRIAAKAYEYIEDHDAVLLDGSTTVLELTKLIAAGERTNLSIITNSLLAMQLLRQKQGCRVIHVGGQMMSEINATFGPLAENSVRNLKVEKCFLGTNGIEVGYGYSSPSFEEASLKRTMLASSKVSFILSDHTKFGESYLGKFAEFQGDVDYLITDALPVGDDAPHYRQSVELVLA